MAVDLVLALLFAASLTLYAVKRGGKPERITVAIMAFGIVADRIGHAVFDYGNFMNFSALRLSFDLIQFSGFLWVAIYANRVWPIWVAAAQVVALTGSIAPLAYGGGQTQAYWALTQLPFFIQLLAITLGTIAHDRRVARVGLYNCWSPRAN